MNQTNQKTKKTNSAIIKSPHLNHNESPPHDSTSKRAQFMIRKRPEIERMLQEEE